MADVGELGSMVRIVVKMMKSKNIERIRWASYVGCLLRTCLGRYSTPDGSRNTAVIPRKQSCSYVGPGNAYKEIHPCCTFQNAVMSVMILSRSFSLPFEMMLRQWYSITAYLPL